MKFRMIRKINHIQALGLTIAVGVLLPMLLILVIAKGSEIDAYMIHEGGFFGFIIVLSVIISLIRIGRERW